MVRGFDEDVIHWVDDGSAKREKGTQTLADVLRKVLH